VLRTPVLDRDCQTVAIGSLAPFSAADPVETPPPRLSLAGSSVGSRARLTVRLPEPGEVFSGFRLMEELGHGTFARVYLARQEALAGREVAVKLSLKATREPERLARLQHTNVVPVYSVHTQSAVQVICMPFLGRRTLADALLGHRKGQPAPGQSTRKAFATKRGSSIADSRSGRLPAPKSDSSPDIVCDTDPLLRDVPRVLTILKQLAEGLAHAHERGVLHLDLKPANVLLADTGEPMLLDFNLSFDESEGKREVVGGTIPYMAPEQLLDLQSRGKGAIDARTDLYSLGVMAFELLAARHPFPVNARNMTEFGHLIAMREAGPPELREINPEIPAAVESIVRKLLAPKPENRYQTARQLVEDLDRQITDRPLRFAPDRSPTERLNKWRRRNPRALVALVVAAVVAAAGGTGAFAYSEVQRREVGEAESRARRTQDGLDAARLDLVLPNDAAARARGMNAALQLLGEWNLPHDPKWQSKPAFQRVPARQKPILSADIGELLLLTALARWESDRTPAAAAEARYLNELAGGCYADAPPFLVRQRAELDAAIAGQAVEIPELPAPSTARDYFLDGAALFVLGKFDAATRPLEKAIAAQPNHGAAQFLLARCRQHLGQYERAVERYQSAGVLLPKDARPAYFMGISYGNLGRPIAAEECFATAIELDAKFGDAYRARGVARTEQHEFEAAEADFTAALANGASKLQSLHLRAHARKALGDANGAAADLKEAATLTPETDLDYLARSYTRMKAAPRDALKDLQVALEKNPTSLAAMLNLIQLHADALNDDKAARAAAKRLVEIYPEYEMGRALLALTSARLGERDAAIREVEACRKLLDQKGPGNRDPQVICRLSGVYSVLSKHNPADRTEAFKLLKEACRNGLRNLPQLDEDRDLEPIRDSDEFRRIVQSAKELAN
jgi:serine/threonine protein kinase/tetratricopeptide (TPR) repeat protein